MSAQAFETALARLFADAAFRERFLADADSALAGMGLTARESADLGDIDRIGLEMAARSYARKKAGRAGRATSGENAVRGSHGA